jgi:succinate dehydrogenase / fumarate reductase, cytochrome b subunit
MKWLFRSLNSSVGKKGLMALTGLLLLGFLLGHLGGNFLLLQGEQSFNAYSHYLISHPLIIPIELGLLLIFVVHVGLAIRLSLENKFSRPVDYAAPLCETHQKLSSATMLITGVALILFVVVHLIGIKYGPVYFTPAKDGTVIRDLYRLTLEYFKNPTMVLFYSAGMVILGVHLSHAFWSACQTLGLTSRKTSGPLKGLSLFLAVFLAGGYLALVLWASLERVN